MKNNAEELEVDKLNAIYQECKVWDSLVLVTEWFNKHGVDIQITSKNGCIQTISITYDEFDLVKKAIIKLESL